MPAATILAASLVAELILYNGTIHTLDPNLPAAQAVASAGGRIIYVGDSASALRLQGPSTRAIDLRGATVVPGLTDAHGHMSGLGLALNRLDLVGTGSASEIAGMVRAKAASLAAGQWIEGRGWDQNDWKDSHFPTRQALDEAAPRNPVALTRVDGHALWANTAAMRAAGVGRQTVDPDGGHIERDASGEPSGVFVDNAQSLIRSKIPHPTRGEVREALQRAMQRCLEAGLTEVHDAGVTAMELDLYRELLVDGGFPFRIYAMLADDTEMVASDRPDLIADLMQKGPQIGLGDGRLTVRAVKLYIDGALGSRGAALLAPYDDDPNNTGLLRKEPARLRLAMERAARLGFQVCVHAIGDRGNRLTLDAMEAALKSTGAKDARFRVEHAQTLAPADIPRFAALGVIASMQPTHATSDMPWAALRLGPQRIQGAYAWRSLLASGARLACGSDFPVESERPLLGLYAAVTRQDLDGKPPDGWFPQQRLTRQEALGCFTTGAAYAAFEEGSRGSISAGKLADLTVLDADIMTVEPARIPATRVLMTIVGGKVAHQRK